MKKLVVMPHHHIHHPSPSLSNLNQLLLPPHPIIPLLLSTTTSTNQHAVNPEPLHSYSITTGLILHTFFSSRILRLCLNSTTIPIRYTDTVFESIPSPDVYTWNLMLCHRSHHSFYFRMRAAGLPPNTYSFALLVRCCALTEGGAGEMAHGQVVKCGVEDVVVVRNSLMGMYCNVDMVVSARKLFDGFSHLDLVSYNTLVSAYGKSGDVKTAREVFDAMPDRNLVSWSAMIDGYVRNGECREALRLFREMQEDITVRVEVDVVVLVSVLKACAHLGALDQGMWIHLLVRRSGAMGRGGVGTNVILATALVDMYCKCGCVNSALDVFNDAASHGDVVLWNAMIGGLAVHGHATDALGLFWRMQDRGISPNESTFLSVLSACDHAGVVEYGIKLFESMKKDHGITPGREHYGCLADLLGRAGLVKEAEELLLAMPVEAQASQWGALMSACQTHNNTEVGERVGRHLIKLDPEDGGRYVSLSKVYMAAGRQEDAREAREKMEKSGARKETGCSFVECDGGVHEFVAGDTERLLAAARSSCAADVYAMLKVLGKGSLEEEMS